MPIRSLTRVALAAALLAAVVACVISYVSIVRTDRVQDRFIANPDPGPALRKLQAAGSWLAPSTTREKSLALLLFATGRHAAAERSIARVVREQPGNAIAIVALTRVQVARGRRAAARATWARAHELDPHLPRQLPAGF